MINQANRKASKILIVDDLHQNLIAMKEVLEEVDAELFTADSGDKALRLMIEHDFSLVLLDVQMPIMDGFETAKLMQKNKKTRLTPIIFVTAINKEQKYVFRGYEVGAIDYLFKPLDPHILISKVELFLKVEQQSQSQILKTVSELRVVKDKLKGKNEKLSHLALHDSLTNLSNRYQFERDLNKRLQSAKRRGDDKFAVIFLDLDNFKSINDCFGHQVGDNLLKSLASVLQRHVRKGDFIARMGGDEFAILLSQIEDYKDAGVVAQNIRRTIECPIEIDNNRIYTSFSIGIACYPFAAIDADELMRKADIAMYRAKELGKNQLCYFSDELQEKHKHRKTIELALYDSIKNQEYSLVYQLIFDLVEKKPIGIEIFLRWTHEKLGTLHPREFIPIAEEIGFMDKISSWILTESSKQIRTWSEAGFEGLFFAVNLSLNEIRSAQLYEGLKKLISSCGVSSNRIMLEINEDVLQIMIEREKSLLEKFKKMGLQIMIDDFGTGYSSLLTMQHLPVYALKIDQGFVGSLCEKHDSELIVKTILSLGDNLGLKVIAEGIETEKQLKVLLKNGCTYGQGYLFAKPDKASAVSKTLEKIYERR